MKRLGLVDLVRFVVDNSLMKYFILSIAINFMLASCSNIMGNCTYDIGYEDVWEERNFKSICKNSTEYTKGYNTAKVDYQEYNQGCYDGDNGNEKSKNTGYYSMGFEDCD